MELKAQTSGNELAAERFLSQSVSVKSFTRKRPVRRGFPEDLPRERVVVEAPKVYACCGSARIRKLGEDITDTLEVISKPPGKHA